MLHASPRHFFANDYSIMRGDEQVAFLDVAVVRDRGVIEVGDSRLRVEKRGVLRSRYNLEIDGAPVARGEKSSMLRDRVELHLGDAVCQIRRRRIFSSRFIVMNGDREIGEIRRAAWYSRRAVIDLPDDWPLGLQVFVFWIVSLFWKRDRQASSGGSPG